MDKTQRIIVVLLILAILFSVLSIFIGISTVKELSLPSRSVSGNVAGNGAGNVIFYVESNPSNLGSAVSGAP